jgi:hypothetical protein
MPVGYVHAGAAGFNPVDEIVSSYLITFRIVLVEVTQLLVLGEGLKKRKYGIFHAARVPLSSL